MSPNALASKSGAAAPSAVQSDLAPTALYTAGVWAWARVPGAELFDHQDSRNVFGVVNFAMAIARLFQWGRPSLAHSLAQRHAMIDALVQQSLDEQRQTHANAQLLELACGFSARAARFSADPRTRCSELDRPAVIARKRALLDRSEAGRAVLARENLQLVEGDLAELSADALAALVPDPAAPLCIVAEGLFMYLDAGAQRALWARLRALLGPGGGQLIFDLVPAREQPSPGLLGRALAWLMRKSTRGGDFVRDERTRDEIAAELRASGFRDVRLFEPATAPAEWKLPHLDRRTQQLVFCARVPTP